MDPDRLAWLAALPERLAEAVGGTELAEATNADGVVGLTSVVRPDHLLVGDRQLPSMTPRIELAFDPPVDARWLSDAWGLTQPLAVSGDVHQASWQLVLRGPDLPDLHGPRVAVDPVRFGRWQLRVDLAGRPPGPLPGLTAGASPAYDLLERGGEAVRLEIGATPIRSEVVAPDHPDARALLRALAAFHPHWRGGWRVPAGAQFVVVYDAGREVAGAAILVDSDGIAQAACLGVHPDRQARHAGSALLDALEAVALDGGAHRICLDASAFLGTDIPYREHGYRTAPPYEGDADALVWAERELSLP